jgi:hypothetical protein
MHSSCRLLVFGLTLALIVATLPAHAARPLLDYHRLDAYFALYAPDSNVPWKSSTVRLDTYTSAPVDFSVFHVDPADVILAGSTTRPRSIDTRRMKAIASWRYTPPGGYRFQSNDVNVPLGSREGFFVVEARRGGVGDQVWINRTRIGLVTKETALGITLYGANLASGKPLVHMRVSFIVKGRFSDRFTDARGLVTWRGEPRPLFALAQWGASVAFVSFLPQAPLPITIVAVKTASAVVHAGDTLQVVGFARSRTGDRLRPSTGSALIQLRSRFGVAAQSSVHLDPAGAFALPLRVPASSNAGDYTVIATVHGSSAGAAVHVDANAAGLSLALAPTCAASCDADADIPLVLRASRGPSPVAGVRATVRIIRSPHAYADDSTDEPWGVTQWHTVTVTTSQDGRALIEIPHPTDGLASTYGVRATSGGATADTRIVVPTSRVALRVQLQRDDIGSGEPAAFDIYATDATSRKAVQGIAVRVQLVHGASVQEQTVTLDDRGYAHGAFTSPQVGSNLVVARVLGAQRAMDAAQVQVEPQTLQMHSAQASTRVAIVLDRKRYTAGQQARVDAFLAGAQGSALLTLESGTSTQARVIPVHDGRVTSNVRIGNAAGVLSVGLAFVRDGTLQWDSVPLVVDAPGRPINAALQLDRASYVPGSTATATLANVRAGAGTLIVRVTKTVPTGSALFASAPDLLAIGTTTTQDTAAQGASWHPWVDSTGDHAVIQTFLRRSAPPADLTMTQADTASVYWKIDRESGDSVHVPVPGSPGRYILTLLKVHDDGRVTAASGDLIVQ